MNQRKSAFLSLTVLAALVVSAALPDATAADAPRRNLYWGDTHLHTSYSPDAFLLQNRSATPDTAYKYARGLPVIHPLHRARGQIRTPLDFLVVVSDHAEFMGVVPKILQGDPLVTGTPTGKRYAEMAAQGREIEVFSDLIAQVNGVIPPSPDLNSTEINSTVWTDPQFDPGHSAFYYVRVLQIPTPRHTLLDAIALGIDPAETGHPATIQERAYSSPIWYSSR